MLDILFSIFSVSEVLTAIIQIPGSLMVLFAWLIGKEELQLATKNVRWINIRMSTLVYSISSLAYWMCIGIDRLVPLPSQGMYDTLMGVVILSLAVTCGAVFYSMALALRDNSPLRPILSSVAFAFYVYVVIVTGSALLSVHHHVIEACMYTTVFIAAVSQWVIVMYMAYEIEAVSRARANSGSGRATS